MKLDYWHIRKVYDKKGYTFYDDMKEFNVNIFGIRCAVDTNYYDDLICVAYRDEFKYEVVEIFQGTTDPGKYWLQNPMNNSGGTACLVPGQYKAYKIDKHNGQYDAICQRRGKVKVYRDGNLDTIHDMDVDSITEGFYGINIHRGSLHSFTYVNKWSAGCQVISIGFDRLMEIAKKSVSIYGNKLTYTLFDRTDFEL